ncbi:hypothetical protein [Burkholderia sp. Ac-20353]|uniref:hypothetical protein n=1 Tax=Burkholderia sp. Ac-20353 TaxID=2703894 RepID=UPI00197C79AE|nr:hypothetical protein [Burkholderia sp. Ac-20353]MBN3788497.1 hypothetical protein [Burkholderia sp. Ac-20353]
MKLYTSDNGDLMEVDALKPSGDHLVITGTIMGAMPIEAHLTPAELRSALKLLSFRVVFLLLKMLFTTESVKSEPSATL